MTTQQLACFREVAKLSSFSQAAENLYISQPTLSRQIASLEDELGVQLFVRANNTVRLSGIGAALYPKLTQMLDTFSKDNAEVFELIAELSNRFIVGIQSGQQMDDCFCRTLRRMKDELPEMDIRIHDLDYEEAPPALLDGNVDVLLCLERSIPLTSNLQFLMLTEETFCLAVPTSHPNSDRKELTHPMIGTCFGDLPFRLLDTQVFEAPLRPALKQVLQEQSPFDAAAHPSFVMSMNDLCLLVSAGLGMTYTNTGSTLELNPDVRLIPLKAGSDSDRYETVRKGVVWRTANEKPMLSRFLELLRTAYPSG